jgi:hypothetical protein
MNHWYEKWIPIKNPFKIDRKVEDGEPLQEYVLYKYNLLYHEYFQCLRVENYQWNKWQNR